MGAILEIVYFTKVTPFNRVKINFTDNTNPKIGMDF
jgi:hypothetical protein